MASVQGRNEHRRESNNEINRNAQKRRVIMMPDNLRLTNMRSMRTTEVNDIYILYVNLNNRYQYESNLF